MNRDVQIAQMFPEQKNLSSWHWEVRVTFDFEIEFFDCPSEDIMHTNHWLSVQEAEETGIFTVSRDAILTEDLGMHQVSANISAKAPDWD
jgi:hypothetical protein